MCIEVMSKYKFYISIASWNVQGWKSKDFHKTDDPDFLDEIKKHHIIAIQETHCAPNTYFQVPGYYVHQVNRKLSGKKAHGGIAFLVKNELKNGIKFINTTSNDMLWLCMKKHYFNIPDDIYVGTAYVSPFNSSYTRKCDSNPFDLIENEISKYCSKGRVILMGDFNSRTCTYPDFVTNDDIRYVPVPPNYVSDIDLCNRRSQDVACKNCTYGKYLLEMCKTTGLKIANGCVLGTPCENSLAINTMAAA